MKIGILTFHRAINYGAVLQCYALYKTLREMGHEVEVIDYRPKAIEKYRMHFRFVDFLSKETFIDRLRYVVSCLTLIINKERTSRKFDDFLSEKFNHSKTIVSENDIPTYYDAIFFGSDQIWNPSDCEGIDKVYWGQFHKGTTKFFTFAASAGRLDLLKGETLYLINRYIKVYDVISVREKSLQDFLMENCSVDSVVISDPSLLLSREECEALAEKPKDENFVLLFSLVGNPNAEKFAQDIAHQLNANIIKIGAVENPLKKQRVKLRACLSINEFFGYIKYARCVITDSFHATSFSVIMHKDFYTMLQPNNNDRSKNILHIAGLSDRMVEASKTIEFAHVDYSEVDNRLINEKKNSINYINSCLSLVLS